MAIHDIYDARMLSAVDSSEEYLRLAGPRTLSTFDAHSMVIRCPNGELSTIVEDAVNLLGFQRDELLSDTEKQDLAFVLGVVMGAVLQRDSLMPGSLRDAVGLANGVQG